ncbi:MAG: acyl carrier protein [Deltaproteobacteria bacterium]|nr:acyl carrier protein [Deltaproteobacteria bacterium]
MVSQALEGARCSTLGIRLGAFAAGVARFQMPSREEVAEYVFQLLKEFGQDPTLSLDERATIERDVVMESVAFVEMQVALEERFDVELDPIRIIELNELGLIIEYIHGCAAGVR